MESESATMSDALPETDDDSDRESNWLMRLWLTFWAWFTEPMPFPRDHWYRRKVVILWALWDEFDCDGDPALPESRAGELVDSQSPPS
jgi:hypothetical protein